MLTVEVAHAAPPLPSRLVLTKLYSTGILNINILLAYYISEIILTNQAVVEPSVWVFYSVSS